MPYYLSIHRAPGLNAQEMSENMPHVLAAKVATFRQIYANLDSGFLISIFEAPDLEALEDQLEALGFPIDETKEIQFSASREELEQRLSGGQKR